MESVKILKDEVIQRLKVISEGHGVSPNQFLSDILDEYDEEDKIFAERTMKALERVEARGVKGKPASEFLKEMESW